MRDAYLFPDLPTPDGAEPRRPRRAATSLAETGPELERRGEKRVLVTAAPVPRERLARLAELAAAAPVEVWCRLPTLDRRLAAALEPGLPPPGVRLAGLRSAREAGLRAGLLVAPLLVGVHDCERDLADLFAAARRSGAEFLAADVIVPSVQRRRALLREFHRVYPRVAARLAMRGHDGLSSAEERARVEALLAELRRRFDLPSPAGGPRPGLPGVQTRFTFAA